MTPLQLSSGSVEIMKELGSLVEATGRMTGEVDHCVVQASKALAAFIVLCL